MRGENPVDHGGLGVGVGNIPACAGKTSTSWSRRRSFARNIPACAGKTPRKYSTPKSFQEHPRVRGENYRPLLSITHSTGTSPRARGKPSNSHRAHAQTRNIPACAGKTLTSFFRTSIFAEHPRVRGENKSRNVAPVALIGTSPRARGKLGVDMCVWGCIRNIPACAGKTAEGRRWFVRCSEHPRVRGENSSRL